MIPKAEAERLPLNPSFPPEDAWKTDLCMAKARAFYCSAGYDMLNVDISQNGVVMARYFADPVTKEFKAYLIGKPWRRIKLENIIQHVCGLKPRVTTDRYTMSWDVEVADWMWDTDSDVIAECILGDEVTIFENKSEHVIYMDKETRRIGRITDRLKPIIGPNPPGFKGWAASLTQRPSAVCQNRYSKLLLVYQCTECKGVWPRKKKYRQNRSIICPHCGAQLVAMNHTRSEMHNIYLFQAAADGTERWYERFLFTWSFWNETKGEWELHLEDGIIALLRAGERFGDVYYHTGNQQYGDRQSDGCRSHMTSGLIYPDFGGADAFMSQQQKHCLRVLADLQMDVNANYMIMMPENPTIEYLLKGRYYRIAREVIHGGFRLEPEAKSISEALRISQQRCNRLRQINGGRAELEWLRYEERTKRKVSEEDLKWFICHGIDPTETHRGTRAMMARIPSPAAFRHYLEKQSRISGNTPLQTVDMYTDYIKMAAAQGLNLDHEIFYKPKDLQAAHDECVRIAHSEEYKKRSQEVQAKFPDIPEILQSIKDKYTYSNDRYAIVVPDAIEDIIAEGRALGHCIDTTDRYFDRIQHHITYLVFLRKSASQTKSWYTLEIEPGGTVRQQRTTGNRQNKADTEAYMPFIREWQAVVRERISEEDKALAAKSREIRVAEYRELRQKKETVRNGLLAGKLLVDVLEADLVEAG